MLVTTALLTTQVVCVGLIAGTVMGWRIKARDDKHQVIPPSGELEN